MQSPALSCRAAVSVSGIDRASLIQGVDSWILPGTAHNSLPGSAWCSGSVDFGWWAIWPPLSCSPTFPGCRPGRLPVSCLPW